MSDFGYIKLYRKMLDNPIVCKDADHLAIWVYLLLRATHKHINQTFAGSTIVLNPGQLITGRRAISCDIKLGESKIQRVLKSFENAHQIEQQTTPQNRLITIVSWSEYQDSEQPNEQQVNNERTTNEQQVNNERTLTKIKNERMKERKKNTPPITPLDSFFIEDEDLRQAVFSFVEFRKSIKSPMTNKAIELMLQKLNALSPNVSEQIEMINQSIMNGWKGIFPLKNQRTNRIEDILNL